MKHILFALLCIFISSSSLSAIKLSEVLATKPLGKHIGKWKASEFVSENLVGKLFGIPSEQKKSGNYGFLHLKIAIIL